ncbi:hypothetical protein [Mesorhizobium sp. B2-8-3]|uniref:hypothetical protein n=1 Tax=Mesorhizobium sp. B2-8-3 TaxID=2589905 RepID=UPI00112DA461|nr:hypothetical protein [Mesorhizobium sp. B2-8-3]TPJ33653.1 hypothetical protein FJ418_13570 [Mesorhizobium sp. B2-8-3]
MDSSTIDRVAARPATLLTWLDKANKQAMAAILAGDMSPQTTKMFLIGSAAAVAMWLRGRLHYERPEYLAHVLNIMDALPKDAEVLKDPLDKLAQAEVEGTA